MSGPKIDILSPAFVAGLVGIAVTDDAVGFIVAAAAMWLLLFIILLVGAALTAHGASAAENYRDGSPTAS